MGWFMRRNASPSLDGFVWDGYFPFTPSQVIGLDEEDLHEGTIPTAYAKIAHALKTHGVELLPLHDPDDGTYRIGDRHYSNLLPRPPYTWRHATCVFFAMINDQLAGCPLKLYALNSGNDLDGVLLTEAEAEAARAALTARGIRDNHPYFPTENGRKGSPA